MGFDISIALSLYLISFLYAFVIHRGVCMYMTGFSICTMPVSTYKPLFLIFNIRTVKKRWCLRIAEAQHRIGKMTISGSTVVVITTSAVRKTVYDNDRYMINQIKHKIPIWKCEYLADGSEERRDNCHCRKTTGDAHKQVLKSELI